MNLKNIQHAVAAVIAFTVPIALMGGGSWQSLTLGGVLTFVYHWAQSDMSA